MFDRDGLVCFALMFSLMSANNLVINSSHHHHGACAQPSIQPEKVHVYESIEHASGRDKRDARTLGDGDDLQLLSCCCQIVDLGVEGLDKLKRPKFLPLGTVQACHGAPLDGCVVLVDLSNDVDLTSPFSGVLLVDLRIYKCNSREEFYPSDVGLSLTLQEVCCHRNTTIHR
jgi:hypothetical protein